MKIDHSAFQNASYGAVVDNSPIGAVCLGGWVTGGRDSLRGSLVRVGANPAHTNAGGSALGKSCQPRT